MSRPSHRPPAPEHAGAFPALRRLLQRWTAPQIDPDDRMEPDLGNVMAHRPAAARVRCVLPPLSGTRQG